MSVTLPVQFSLNISGTNVSAYEEIFEFTLANKYENSFSIVDTDGDLTLDFSNIENGRFLMLSSESAFDVKFTDVGANVFTISSDGTIPVIIPISSIFFTTYPTIQIATAETTDITVFVRAYGEASS
jgi:hypothetical protein